MLFGGGSAWTANPVGKRRFRTPDVRLGPQLSNGRPDIVVGLGSGSLQRDEFGCDVFDPGGTIVARHGHPLAAAFGVSLAISWQTTLITLWAKDTCHARRIVNGRHEPGRGLMNKA